MSGSSIKCPRCLAVLKLKAEVSPDREVTCPKCRQKFRMGAVAGADLTTRNEPEEKATAAPAATADSNSENESQTADAGTSAGTEDASAPAAGASSLKMVGAVVVAAILVLGAGFFLFGPKSDVVNNNKVSRQIPGKDDTPGGGDDGGGGSGNGSGSGGGTTDPAEQPGSGSGDSSATVNRLVEVDQKSIPAPASRNHFVGHTEDVWAIAISPNETRLATASPNELIVWNVNSRKPLMKWEAPEKSENDLRWISLLFSPDEKVLAELIKDEYQTGWSYPAQLRLWNLHTGEQLATFPVQSFESTNITSSRPQGLEAPLPVVFDSSSKRIFAVSSDRKILLIDCQTGKVTRTIDAASQFSNVEEDSRLQIGVSPDGSKIAAVHGTDQVAVWNLRDATDRPVTATGSARELANVIFSPDGSKLMVGGDRLEFWNILPSGDLSRGATQPHTVEGKICNHPKRNSIVGHFKLNSREQVNELSWDSQNPAFSPSGPEGDGYHFESLEKGHFTQLTETAIGLIDDQHLNVVDWRPVSGLRFSAVAPSGRFVVYSKNNSGESSPPQPIEIIEWQEEAELVTNPIRTVPAWPGEEDSSDGDDKKLLGFPHSKLWSVFEEEAPTKNGKINRVVVWHPSLPTPFVRLSPGLPPESVCGSADGTRLLAVVTAGSSSMQNFLIKWFDVKDPTGSDKQIAMFKFTYQNPRGWSELRCLDISDDGKLAAIYRHRDQALAAGQKQSNQILEQQIVVINLDDPSSQKTVWEDSLDRVSFGKRFARFSPDGSQIALLIEGVLHTDAGYENRDEYRLEIVRLADEQRQVTNLFPFPQRNSLSWSSDSRFLLAKEIGRPTVDLAARLWEVSSIGEPNVSGRSYPHVVNAIIHSDNQHLLTIDQGTNDDGRAGDVVAWDLSSGQKSWSYSLNEVGVVPIPAFNGRHNWEVSQMELSPDGTSLALAIGEHLVLIDPKTGDRQRMIEVHSRRPGGYDEDVRSEIVDFMFSAGGDQIVSIAENGAMFVSATGIEPIEAPAASVEEAVE
ncbi:hypothetical protein KOR42_44690 [Thalassoglobus neptunius]|uniref:WD domain, G-beta repeat n=1 Tax=Thalassoglobus neptunius TaxID=1938619 RepID=A0A5C5VY65_9PLAN|nr:hypothetical protein [Thalassoglobus neptunius]TWT43528.1 hypothetical protein KOR42_44690 [Thalassoglobus neptunius]